MRSFEVPEVEDLAGADPTKREVLWAMLDRSQVQLLALQAEMAHEVQCSRSYRADGHRSAVQWMMAQRSWSMQHARTCLQVGRMMAAMPAVRAAMFDGKIGVDQVAALAQVFANPRCGRRLAEFDAKLLGHAQRKEFDEFRSLLRRWEFLADPMGAFKDLDRINEGRRVQMANACGAFRGEIDGPALAGEQMRHVLEAFARVEFQRDWDELVARVGADHATVSALARTAQQRRFDALHKIFLQAADGATFIPRASVVGNVVIDHATFERGLALLWGVDPGPDDPARFEQMRCHTVDGVDVDPRHAVLANLQGHLRRVLWTAPGIPTEVSSKRRCFTGPMRAAVELLSPHCVHRGCSTPTSRCQIDHLWPSANGGPTTAGNGGPKCGPQNRFAWRSGYRTWRDADGNWHTLRPDGTEIGPADWWDSS